MDVLFGVMSRIGHGVRPLLAATLWTTLGSLAALAPALAMVGFTVDDALIAVRYARHLAAGLGWCFNAHGPSTDGVTPLPWPLVLAPLARADSLAVLERAQALGVVVWATTGALLGRAVASAPLAPAFAKAGAFAALALSVPVAAHAVSGMETPLATALATGAAVAYRRPRLAAGLAGLAASFRPEMAPWACVFAIGIAIASRESVARVVLAAAMGLAPFTCCALVRLFVWGHPVPLALAAKPGEVGQGVAYAAAACVVTVVPVLVLAPVALARTPVALAIVVAAIAHIGAIVIVGGDWMPFARLMVPVVPGLALAAVLASGRAHPAAALSRSFAALALGIALRCGSEGVVADGRRVMADRTALIASARPALAGLSPVAGLDIGWLSAATEADIVDLAGLTDPEIAALPGGHTSKRVDAAFLLARSPEALLLYAPNGLPGGSLPGWAAANYSRAVESRLARDVTIGRHFEPAVWLPLGKNGAGYVLLRAVGSPGEEPL
jgi:hypothetical protein